MFHYILLLCLLSLNQSVAALAQDSAAHAQRQPAQRDSSVVTKTALSQVDKKQSETEIALKDWIGWGLTLLLALLAFWLAGRKKRAELKAEEEHKKRTALEERQREVDKRLAVLEAERSFTKKAEQKEKTQQAKTAEERYRHALETEVCQIHLAAPGLEHTPVNLLDTFVRLNVSEQYRSGEFPELGKEGRAGREHEDLSPEEVMARAFKDHGRKLLLLIGDPGSGKTTLLKYYAALCLQSEGPRKLGFASATLPLYLPLREIVLTKSLAENLAQWADKRDAGIAAKEFETWLRDRATLVLLDGLDEINQLEDRKKACAWLDDKCGGFKRARFVMTSRFTGMRRTDNLVLRTAHLHAEVRDFSAEQKREFLRKWFRAAHLEGSRPLKHETEADWRKRQLREAEQGASEVIAYLEREENRGLRELAGIPMLLQLLALIWKQYKTKPESRTKLYDIALDYLLEYRDDQRELAPLLKAEKARRALGPAALWMQEELDAEEVAKEKLHEFLQPILVPLDNALKAEALCVNLRDRAGVIADYGKNDYIFRHKSFREYFAGLQLVNNYHESGRLARLTKTFGDNAWAEPLRYFMSKADGKAFSAFMTALFNAPLSREFNQTQQNLLQSLVREAPEKPTEALLACLHDETKNANQQRYALDCLKTIAGETVREYLEFYANTNTGNASTLAYAREIAASLAAPAVVASPKTSKPELFLELPRTFRNAVEYQAEYILIPGGTIKYSVTQQIEKAPDLYFAKYPVTNKQYRRFVRYLRAEEPELHQLVSPKVFAERLLKFIAPDKAYADYLGDEAQAWGEKLKSTYDEDRKFNGEEQPVVGVNWYAARAYCFWLSEMQKANSPALAGQKEIIYRLPVEVEWERAAAGRIEDGPGRKYPWPKDKGEPNDKLANYGRNVGQTTPVGRYPAGATPEGLMDMAGNVWEWQENLFGDKDRPSARCLRGGSWGSNAVDLPCAIRYVINPVNSFLNFGIRVARAQSCF